LIRDESRVRFDVLPISLAADGAVDTLGIDVRRLRPNVVIGGVQGLAEREWCGRAIRIGVVEPGEISVGDPVEVLGYWTLDRQSARTQLGAARPAI
jgi:hypothetical protein